MIQFFEVVIIITEKNSFSGDIPRNSASKALFWIGVCVCVCVCVCDHTKYDTQIIFLNVIKRIFSGGGGVGFFRGVLVRFRHSRWVVDLTVKY